jgi:hypothetical protein
MALAALGMLYGLHYAIFVEHQILNEIGSSLASTFAHAAEGEQRAAESALVVFREARYKYVRQVDVHSHWIGLAMLMIVLGLAFDGSSRNQRAQSWMAWAMLAGSLIFPLGVILQTANHGKLVGSILAVGGSALVVFALAAAAWRFAPKKTA